MSLRTQVVACFLFMLGFFPLLPRFWGGEDLLYFGVASFVLFSSLFGDIVRVFENTSSCLFSIYVGVFSPTPSVLGGS